MNTDHPNSRTIEEGGSRLVRVDRIQNPPLDFVLNPAVSSGASGDCDRHAHACRLFAPRKFDLSHEILG